MSEPIVLPPECQINCASASPRDIDCQTSYMWEALEEDFTMPAVGATAVIAVCNSAHYVTNAYIYLEGAGFLKITAKPNSESITVENTGVDGNEDALTVAPADNKFIHLPPIREFEFLTGSDTWDPGNIGNGAEEAKEITVTGAALGDFVLVAFSLDVADLALVGAVTAADTVTAQLLNNTGGAVNLAEGTVTALVIPAK